MDWLEQSEHVDGKLVGKERTNSSMWNREQVSAIGKPRQFYHTILMEMVIRLGDNSLLYRTTTITSGPAVGILLHLLLIHLSVPVCLWRCLFADIILSAPALSHTPHTSWLKVIQFT